MSDREKMIELIQSAVGGCSTYWAGLIADKLIANGVTIPVLCKDCWKWYPYNGGGSHDCPYCGYPDPDDHCSDGERRNDE